MAELLWWSVFYLCGFFSSVFAILALNASIHQQY
uniref:Uncharacterized protein n=1 Tax=Anguilla anguilla TaxID=7936 RepID=A0A0E9W5S5_ANGAN